MSRSRTAIAAVALLFAALPAAAQAQSPTIVANGTAQVKPEPANRKSESSIRKAVREARDKALPKAIADARVRAAELAAAANVTLGGLLSIADAPLAGYPFAYYGQDGTFGPNRYCAQVRRYHTVKRNGVRRRVAGPKRKVCRVPSQVSASVALTFATS
ncbi:MAG TPA: SIMPL domain-containing protein [Solirubrobacter sp.]|nr:SIMPL domain-containing protein [Solirubrobacter sp.]